MLSWRTLCPPAWQGFCFRPVLELGCGGHTCGGSAFSLCHGTLGCHCTYLAITALWHCVMKMPKNESFLAQKFCVRHSALATSSQSQAPHPFLSLSSPCTSLSRLLVVTLPAHLLSCVFPLVSHGLLPPSDCLACGRGPRQPRRGGSVPHGYKMFSLCRYAPELVRAQLLWGWTHAKGTLGSV